VIETVSMGNGTRCTMTREGTEPLADGSCERSCDGARQCKVVRTRVQLIRVYVVFSWFIC
jgi:hypothetical protein